MGLQHTRGAWVLGAGARSLGPLETPIGKGHVSLNLTLRRYVSPAFFLGGPT